MAKMPPKFSNGRPKLSTPLPPARPGLSGGKPARPKAQPGTGFGSGMMMQFKTAGRSAAKPVQTKTGVRPGVKPAQPEAQFGFRRGKTGPRGIDRAMNAFSMAFPRKPRTSAK